MASIHGQLLFAWPAASSHDSYCLTQLLTHAVLPVRLRRGSDQCWHLGVSDLSCVHGCLQCMPRSSCSRPSLRLLPCAPALPL